MGKSESIEALLSPSLRVSRPVAACSRCRAAKVKCDGKLPVCTACEKSGKASSCTSANDDFARGKERSYVSALEAAAQRLQKRIDHTRSNSHLSHDGSKSQTGFGSPGKVRRMPRGCRKEALDVDELVSDFGFLTVNATSRDFHGFTSTMSFSKLLLTMAIIKPLPRNDNHSLPPRSVLTSNVEHYLDTIFTMLPFFSEVELMSMISRTYQDSSKSTPIAPIDLWFIRMISAISAASKSRRRGDENDKIAFQNISAAMNLAEYVLHPGSIVGVQALLLLVQYSLIDPEYLDCWYLIGMASRLVADLGLHCEPSPERKISKDVLDLRRRIFHSVYALDRLISMSFGRSFSFTDDSASDVPLPVLGSEIDGQSPSQIFLRSLKPCLFLFDIRRVQSAFYQTTMYSSRSHWSQAMAARYASSVSHDTEAWYGTIPSSLSPRHLVFFNLERMYTHILVVSPNPKLSIAEMADDNKALVFEYCAQFTEQLQPITRDDSWDGFLTYTDILRTRYVANQFLEVMWSDFDRLLKSQHILDGSGHSSTTTSLQNCSRAIACLRNLSSIFEFAQRRWNLRSFLEKFERESAVLMNRLRNRQQEFAINQNLVMQGDGIDELTRPQYNSTLSHDSQSDPSASSVYSHDTPSQNIDFPLAEMANMQDQDFLNPSFGTQGEGGFSLPQGSLPRRSYEFIGGNG